MKTQRREKRDNARAATGVDVRAALGEPPVDAGITFLSDGKFGVWQVVEWCAATMDASKRWNVALCTWSLAAPEIAAIGAWIHRGHDVRVFVDRSFRGRKPELWGDLMALCGSSVRIARTHAKLALLDDGGRAWVVRSSANLNPAVRLEQFDVDDSRGMLETMRGSLDAVFADPADDGMLVARMVSGLGGTPDPGMDDPFREWSPRWD